MGFLDSVKDSWKKYTPLGQLGLFDDVESRTDDVNLAPFHEDPMFADLQNYLNGYGKNLMEGRPNEYYAGIGQSNSPEFNAVLNNSNRDIMTAAAESAAASGRARGGSLPAITSQAVGDNTANLRFKDYQQSLEGKRALLGLGTGIAENVRSSAFNQQEAKNAYNLGKAKFDFGKQSYLDEFDATAGAAKGKMIGTLIGGGLGFMAGGPAGAMMGANMGGSFMGGGDGGSASSMAWLDAINSSKVPLQTTNPVPGVSQLGRIKRPLYV